MPDGALFGDSTNYILPPSASAMLAEEGQVVGLMVNVAEGPTRRIN